MLAFPRLVSRVEEHLMRIEKEVEENQEAPQALLRFSRPLTSFLSSPYLSLSLSLSLSFRTKSRSPIYSTSTAGFFLQITMKWGKRSAMERERERERHGWR